MQSLIKAFVENENGATSIEYALIASLIAVAIIGSVRALGGGTDGLWSGISQDVGDALSGGGEGEDG